MELELLSIRIVLVKVIMEIGHEKYLLSIFCWKLILGLIISTTSTGKNNNKFLSKKLLLSKL